MTNEEKAREISQQRSYNRNLQIAVYEDMLQMANWKDEQLKEHEQSLLYTVESMLDRLNIEGEARKIALNEFKEHLIFKKNE